MHGTSYTIDAQVKVVRTITDMPQVTSSSTVNQTVAPNASSTLLDTRRPSRSGIISIETYNSISAPYGHFQIELAPQPLDDKGTLPADVLKPASLVVIALHRHGGDPTTDAAVTPQPVPVMIGLIDEPHADEDYSQAGTRRSQYVRGRALSAVLADQRWYFNAWLFNAIGKSLAPGGFSAYFDSAALTDEIKTFAALASGSGAAEILAIDPQFLAQDASHATPLEFINTIYKFMITGIGGKPPFINLAFGDGVPLAQRLVYDPATANFVDPRALILSGLVSTDWISAGNAIGVMKYFVPDAVMESFSDTFGTSLEDAHVQLIIRKPPFAGHIDYGTQGAEVRFATQSGHAPPLFGGTLFDWQHGEWNTKKATMYIDGSDIITSALSTGAQASVSGAGIGMANLFVVQPRQPPTAGNSNAPNPWDAIIAPMVVSNPQAPAYYRRYGLVPLPKVQLNYAPILESDNSTPNGNSNFIRQCLAHEALLYEWHQRFPDMYRGTYTLKGSTNYRAGMRLVDRTHNDRPREFYVTGVRHRLAFGPQAAVSFQTTVEVERGWNLASGAV